MILPANLSAAFRDLLHVELQPENARLVSGGMINPSARVEIAGQRFFAKWNANAAPGLFEVEARGLALLRDAHAFRIPEVLAHAEAAPNAPAYLILEWLEPTPVSAVDDKVYAENFGQALATLHRVSAPTFGLDHENFIGELPQHNTPSASWAEFYRDQRLAVQIEIARARDHLPPYREALLYTLLDRVETLLSGVFNPPTLIHGDLWNGNYFAGVGNQPALFDPAVYFADREIEIAYAQLFGASAFFLDAYSEAYPLDAGYEDRRLLLQLYSLLVHLNHFGERYGEYVDAVCRHYLG